MAGGKDFFAIVVPSSVENIKKYKLSQKYTHSKRKKVDKKQQCNKKTRAREISAVSTVQPSIDFGVFILAVFFLFFLLIVVKTIIAYRTAIARITSIVPVVVVVFEAILDEREIELWNRIPW
jgi:hypothetical protein